MLGRITGRTLDGVTGTRTFDALGRVATQVDPIGTFTFAYDGATARLQSLAYPNGQTSTYAYFSNTGDRRLQDIHHQTNGGATLSAQAFEILGCERPRRRMEGRVRLRRPITGRVECHA